MKLEHILFEVTVEGRVSTRSSGIHYAIWRDQLEYQLQLIPLNLTRHKMFALRIQVWIENKRFWSKGRLDWDNIVKPTQDSMQRVGLISNDSVICDAHVTKYPTDYGERMILTVQEWQP